KIFSADPDNIEAHDKAKAVALATGRNEDAIASLETVLRLSVERGDPRADEARDELRQLDPGNPALSPGGGAEPVEEELVAETVGEEVVAAEVEPAAAPAAEEDEFASDLAEADFYVQAGLPEDARAVLEGILLAVPNHPAATRMLRELGGGAPETAQPQEP